MGGSSYGKLYTVTTWGESHGPALGAVVDGCPAGIPLTEEDIQSYLDRRKPGRNAAQTSRSEADRVEILSGVFEGRTTGTPISLLIRNTSQRSGDYGNLADTYRPGHADYTFDAKYGIRDYRGGGRASGRETAGRVAAGAIAARVLQELGISVECCTRSIGEVEADFSAYDRSVALTCETAMPDPDANRRALELLEQTKASGDSLGGVMECVIRGVPAGVGDPVFEKLDANLARAAMSIGAVKAVEIGDGCAVSRKCGSEVNDPFLSADDGSVKKTSNHAGGILGGISDGADIVVRAYVKPTPSISKPQQTVNSRGEEVTLEVKGRHDPVIVPRAVVVLEA
ncbi:MAG: chorismate synthase, partial [Lachnospiraceae bacterium]|nr:chorismate synthase [Lachnospiraceae bacterium]